MDDARDIWFTGLGYRNDSFDFSVEYIALDESFGGTEEDDTYIVAETTYYPTRDWAVYFDYGNADQLDLDTYRLGASYSYNKHVSLALEYARDEFDDEEIESVDARVSFNY